MEKPIHIALCTDGVFPQAMGGMQRHSRLLAEHAAAIDQVRITVLHPHPERVFDPVHGIAEVQVRGIDTSRFYLREMWRYSGRMAQALAKLDADVVLAQGFCVWKDLDRFAGRTVFHPHGLEMFQGLSLKDRALGLPFRRLVTDLVRRTACTISLGGKLTTILRGVGAKRVEVLPNGVEVPGDPVPYPVEEGPLRLLFVGRFAFNKGIDLLVEVARRLEHEGLGDRVLFQLAGDGPLLARYQAIGLPGNVELLGRVNDEKLFSLYNDCHGFVLPTRFEGMPTVVLEAMARARPVIVSDVGASAELVATGRNGWLLPPGDPGPLYAAVRSWMDLPAHQRAAMGREGHHLAHHRFAWPVVARAHVDLCRKVHAAQRL